MDGRENEARSVEHVAQRHHHMSLVEVLFTSHPIRWPPFDKSLPLLRYTKVNEIIQSMILDPIVCRSESPALAKQTYCIIETAKVVTFIAPFSMLPLVVRNPLPSCNVPIQMHKFNHNSRPWYLIEYKIQKGVGKWKAIFQPFGVVNQRRSLRRSVWPVCKSKCRPKMSCKRCSISACQPSYFIKGRGCSSRLHR